MAIAQDILMTCVKSIVHGVSASAKYLATSTNVHRVAMNESAILVTSHLFVRSDLHFNNRVIWLNLHHLNSWSVVVVVLVLERLHRVAQSPGEKTNHGHSQDEL